MWGPRCRAFYIVSGFNYGGFTVIVDNELSEKDISLAQLTLIVTSVLINHTIEQQSTVLK